MQKPSDLRLWPSDSRTLRTSPHFDAGRFAKEFGDEGHREGCACTTSAVKGQKLTATAQRCILRCWRCVAGGDWSPVLWLYEEGIGFHKGIHQLANVENQIRVHRNRMLTLKRAATSLQAYWFARRCGWAGCRCQRDGGAELGRQQKKDNADSRGE